MKKFFVYKRKTRDREKFIHDYLDIMSEEIRGARRILLKPNIVSFEQYPTTTHPSVLSSTLEYLINFRERARECEDYEIIVADGPAPDAGDTKRIIEEHVLKKVCEKYEVPIFDLLSTKMREIKAGREGMNFEISQFAFTHDLTISLPVLKSHKVTTITAALKNQFGFFSANDREKFHTNFSGKRLKDIHRGIAELNTVIKPKIFIVDAVETLINANERRHGGVKKKLGYMLGGNNPVALDIVGFELLKNVDEKLREKKAEDVLHLKYAMNMDLNSTKSKYEGVEVEVIEM